VRQWQAEALFKTRRRHIQAIKELDQLAGAVETLEMVGLHAVSITADVDQLIGHFPKQIVLLLIARSRTEHADVLNKIDKALLQHGITVEQWHDYKPKPEVQSSGIPPSLDEFLESLNDQAQPTV
jgi:hypothetical protein